MMHCELPETWQRGLMHTDRVAKAKATGEARVAAESCQGLYMLSTDIILNAFVPFGSGHGLPILWTNPCQPLRISFVSVFFFFRFAAGKLGIVLKMAISMHSLVRIQSLCFVSQHCFPAAGQPTVTCAGTLLGCKAYYDDCKLAASCCLTCESDVLEWQRALSGGFGTAAAAMQLVRVSSISHFAQ